MIYTAIDTFYLTEDHLTNSPSRKDAIDQETEITLLIYGCDLIQESGILLRLPQAVMATGQVLFHRFYCQKSFARFYAKRVAASCVWLASKLEESPRKARQVLFVFHRMECRRENLPVQHLDLYSKKYSELKMELIRTERHLLKEMCFICHVEHPHKFISNYLAPVLELKEPSNLRQDAWNLGNDSLQTTLCVRFKSEVVACGVVYAAAGRFGVPLPENPPWWKVFDADKSGIDEVCRVPAHLYSRPKAKYIPVCKESVSFTSSNKSWDSQNTAVPKEGSVNTPVASADTGVTKTASGAAASVDTGGSRDALVKQALDKMKDSKRSDGESRDTANGSEGREDIMVRLKPELRTETSSVRNMDTERDRYRDRDRDREKDRVRDRDRERDGNRDRQKSRDRERGRDSYRERERDDIEWEIVNEISHRSRDKPLIARRRKC
ncbi:cyclin-L1-1-like [Chenopodium quinoa]|uniref:cyclin-L1-1-like n=1 Tax=Chenopodium quinoa TaxID=63459 RepID=UPI000B78E914|nr:cyclin-L1-1-like [Chenopodium quinoa]